jgi:hypothetical protein
MGLGSAFVGRHQADCAASLRKPVRSARSNGFYETAVIDWQSIWKPETMSAWICSADLERPVMDSVRCESAMASHGPGYGRPCLLRKQRAAPAWSLEAESSC